MTLDSFEDLRAQAQELMEKKDEIESRVLDLEKSLGPVGMTGPLVDSAGFPRADLDLYAIRNARHDILCLRNDHKAIMAQIESKLHEIHASAGQAELVAAASSSSSTLCKPFARVNAVLSNSPAALAGLEKEDLIVAFGDVTAADEDSLVKVGQLVQAKENATVFVQVLRDLSLDPNQAPLKSALTLMLVPKQWEGRGLLGCHIVPAASA